MQNNYSFQDIWDILSKYINNKQISWNHLTTLLNKNNTEAWVNKDKILSKQEVIQCFYLIEKVKYKIPLGRIVKRRYFWKDEFIVSPFTLEPRPETEAIIEHSLKLSPKSILDIGTGTGCILLSLLREHDAFGHGVDISPFVIDAAKENAKKLNIKSDFSVNIPKIKFDLIVSNPPYVQTDVDFATKFDPISAVFHNDPVIITKNLPLTSNGTFLCEVPKYLKKSYENHFSNYIWHKSSHPEILIFQYTNTNF